MGFSGTPKDMGAPEMGFAGPSWSHSHVRIPKSYGVLGYGMGIVWVQLTIKGVPCPWGSRVNHPGDFRGHGTFVFRGLFYL